MCRLRSRSATRPPRGSFFTSTFIIPCSTFGVRLLPRSNKEYRMMKSEQCAGCGAGVGSNCRAALLPTSTFIIPCSTFGVRLFRQSGKGSAAAAPVKFGGSGKMGKITELSDTQIRVTRLGFARTYVTQYRVPGKKWLLDCLAFGLFGKTAEETARHSSERQTVKQPKCQKAKAKHRALPQRVSFVE